MGMRTTEHKTSGVWPTLELVVARYAEDLLWLRRVPRRFRVTVYDKGAEDPVLPQRHHLTRVQIPNRGREEYGYLRHILDRYDDLADITVFSQGKPFDHVPDFHKQLHALAFHQLAVADFHWLGFIIDEDDAEGRLLFQRWACNPEGDTLPMNEFWNELFAEAPPHVKTFYPSAHFAVTAECVRRRPREFYQRALQLSAELPHAGHCFERAWDAVFGVDGIPPDYRLQPKPIYLRKIRAQRRS